MTLWQSANPCCVLLAGVVTSCVLCARLRGRVSRSCATENTYNIFDKSMQTNEYELNLDTMPCNEMKVLELSFRCNCITWFEITVEGAAMAAAVVTPTQ